MKTNRLLKIFMPAIAAVVGISAGVNLMSIDADATMTGTLSDTFFDNAWKKDSTYSYDTVYCKGKIIGTGFIYYEDNVGNDKVRGAYTPVDGSGFCSIKTNGKYSAATKTVRAGEKVYSAKITYVGGREAKVICTRE